MTRLYPITEQTDDKTQLQTVCGAANVAPLTARALIRRGMTDEQSVRAFLHAETEPLCDPLLLPDMDKAVLRIVDAIRRDEYICVYGDYDADGICASAILIRSLETLGARVLRYIPSRHTEGYGLNAEAVKKLALQYVDLLITVDNGVSAFDEIALCRALGIDVIVTDHHSIGEAIPDCCAVVSAIRKDSVYPNRNLCGAGVALKLAQALLPQEDHSADLALAAVATVTDVVPLIGENRAIVAQGMHYIGKSPGLAALLRVAGWKEQAMTEQTLAFLIGPRLNASGRMSDAMRGVELLLSEDRAEAERLAKQLDDNNTARREAEAAIFSEAEQEIDPDQRAILIAHEGWNPGVIGIVASRLCEKFQRPAILFTEQNGVLTGSGRCPAGINLFLTLSELSGYFVRYGGHARAAGITILRENFAAFCEEFYRCMDAFDESRFKPSCGYEEDVRLSELTLVNVRELGLLAPFGEGNPVPVYRVHNAKLANVSVMGRDGAHLCGTVAQGDERMRMVAFRQGERYEALSADHAWDLAVTPQINSFRGKETVELTFIAASRILPTEPALDPHDKIVGAFFLDSVYNGFDKDDTISARYFLNAQVAERLTQAQNMRAAFCGWRTVLASSEPSPEELVETHSDGELLTLLVFLELAFFTFDAKTGRFGVSENKTIRRLTESALYRALSNTAGGQTLSKT